MKNKYEIRGEVTAILMVHKGATLETLIDTEQLVELLKIRCRWVVDFHPKTKLYYVRTFIENKKIYLHRLLMNAPKELLIDHIDGNSLNNCMSNLRLANKSQNAQNLNRARSNNTSGIRGVCWHKAAGKWTASIKVNYKDVYLGLFANLNEAEEVVKEARAKLMPFSKEASERGGSKQ